MIRTSANVIFKKYHIEINRRLTFKGGIFAEYKFDLEELFDIDFNFIDIFMMGQDSIMNPIPIVNFSNPIEDKNIVKFIPNENLFKLNDEETRRANR
jgi:hypothetical protein